MVQSQNVDGQKNDGDQSNPKKLNNFYCSLIFIIFKNYIYFTYHIKKLNPNKHFKDKYNGLPQSKARQQK